MAGRGAGLQRFLLAYLVGVSDVAVLCVSDSVCLSVFLLSGCDFYRCALWCGVWAARAIKGGVDSFFVATHWWQLARQAVGASASNQHGASSSIAVELLLVHQAWFPCRAFASLVRGSWQARLGFAVGCAVGLWFTFYVFFLLLVGFGFGRRVFCVVLGGMWVAMLKVESIRLSWLRIGGS